eukprot:3859665-Rhodomonas_salina.1
MSGTEIWRMGLRGCHAVSGTDLAYRTTRMEDYNLSTLWYRPTPCPVLTYWPRPYSPTPCPVLTYDRVYYQ